MTENAAEIASAEPALTASPVVRSVRSRESLALAIGAIAFVVVALVALPVLHFQSVPIDGAGSLGQYIAISTAVISALAFAFGRYVVRDRVRRVGFLDVVDIVVVAIALGVIALLTWTLLADILGRSFEGAEVFALPSLLIAGAAAALTAYAAFVASTQLTLEFLAFLLALFLVEGMITSMLTSADPAWWKLNLSELGSTGDFSALAFNATLIVSGAMVVTLARHATRGVAAASRRSLLWVRGLLITIGVFLACVGIFPVNEFLLVHNSVATGMAVAYTVLIIGLPRWLPGIPRAFLIVSWVFVAIIVVAGVLFGIGYYTLTATELVAAGLIFSWIILFLRNVAALQQDASGVAAE
ncbi:DUF998 domain-containing protein [Microbacterium sp. ASV49]|uniref:DUF998 domain-containing protein n=1 Tax=Microbacterium candidum TaxID=3041922 RepID=A0ABT7MTC2_9MICO|nr:DUF998 domain-containing protein [Microbacterium sp. ASV49]MDL9977707.1 DUF998 domain-containing protein [Microbacterium sp. ASV49]